MASRKVTRVFISYARNDGAALAQRLAGDLAAEGFRGWTDIEEIAGGESWTAAIETAIDTSDVVLALLTPASYRSEICRAEQLRSLRKGKCVIPLLAAPGSDVPLHLEAEHYRDFTTKSGYAGGFHDLLRDIERRNGVVLPERYRITRVTYVTAPPMVANYIERPEALRALRDTLFAADGGRATALTALEGMGGIGKTVLAMALCRDEAVQQAFPDGVVWITAGRQPMYDVRTRMQEIAKALGDDVSRYENDLASENQYRSTIANKAALIVIDDVWSKADLDPFFAESPRSRFLFTTRDAGIARFRNAREHRVDLLDEPQSRELLALWAGVAVAQLPPVADDVIHECGRLPLALSVVGALLRKASPAEWNDWLRRLRNADLAAISKRLPKGQESFFRAVEVSVNDLEPEMQERYKKLAVLRENMTTPSPILETLWNLDAAECRTTASYLVDRSLSQRDDATASIRLHDLQLDYIRAQYSDRQGLDLIRGAVHLSSHVIERDPWQFASQVAGRLLPHEALPAVREFTKSLIQGSRGPWLRLTRSTLHPPGTSLVCTLEGHCASVQAVAVNPDGRRAISACDDGTLKVWDLETGRQVRTLEGHSADVNGVAVSSDGLLAVSASWDNTLKMWDLETGRELRTLQGHSDYVYGVAVSPDGRFVVSASGDKTLKVWDLETGRQLRTLEGHSADVSGVAVSPDGRLVISASWDKTLKVWDLETGRQLRMLGGHSAEVSAVAVSPDGRLVISASWDKTLKVWNLETGRQLRTLRQCLTHLSFVEGTGMVRREALSPSVVQEYGTKAEKHHRCDSHDNRLCSPGRVRKRRSQIGYQANQKQHQNGEQRPARWIHSLRYCQSANQ